MIMLRHWGARSARALFGTTKCYDYVYKRMSEGLHMGGLRLLVKETRRKLKLGGRGWL